MTDTFAPLHQPYPWSSSETAIIAIRTVARNLDALREFVPEPLTPLEGGAVWLWLIQIREFAGCAGYNELIVNVPVTGFGDTYGYCPTAYVDNDAAMASGRERMGVPKKFAEISIGRANDQMVGTVTRSGVTFATLGMTLDRQATAEELAKYSRGFNGKSLGYIDSLDVDGNMNRLWLQGNSSGNLTSAIKGRGFVDIRPSASDPLYLLDLEAVSATYFRNGASDLLPATPVFSERIQDGEGA